MIKYRGFTKIVAGMLFIFINFKLQGFDIIPDPIGYILIISGLVSLSSLHNSFRKAVPFVIGSLILSIIDVFISVQTGGNNIPLSSVVGMKMGVAWIISILGGIFGIVFLTFLCKGTTELLNDCNFFNDSRITRNCITCNIIIRVLSCMPFLMLFVAIPILSIPFLIIGLIFNIWLMVRLYRGYKLLSEYDDTEFINTKTNFTDSN